MNLKNINIKTERKKILFTAVIAVIVVIVVASAVKLHMNGSDNVMEYSADSKAAFRTYDNGAIQYTGDGAFYYNSNGEKLWSDAYQMSVPLSVSNDGYTAVYEIDGRSVRVYNEMGLAYSIQTNDAIVGVSLSKNGSVAVITGGKSYIVSVYGHTGKLIFERVEGNNGVYPVCSSISPDGEVIAISYVDTSGVRIKSKIGLFYINEERGAEYTDSIYSAVEMDNELIFGVYFLSDDVFAAIGDRNIYTIGSDGIEKNRTAVTNEITGMGFCGNKLAIAFGEELPSSDGAEVGTVAFLSSNGKLTAGESIGMVPNYFSSSKGGVVLGSGNKFFGINKDGSISWLLNTSGEVTGIYPSANINECYYATRTWAVLADMRDFDTYHYNPDLKKIEIETTPETVEGEIMPDPNTIQQEEPTETTVPEEQPIENTENTEIETVEEPEENNTGEDNRDTSEVKPEGTGSTGIRGPEVPVVSDKE